MLIRTGSICFAFSLAALAAACGSSTDNDPHDSNTAGTSAAGSNTNAGSSAAGSGTSGGSSSSGGTNAAGTSSSAGQTSAAGHAGMGGSSALGGQGGQGGTGGSNPSTAGAANGGGPASTEGLTFSGSCLDAVHCTDEWDVTFGVDALEQICTAQEGTWSTGHCVTTPWKKKCTQSVFGGVYVQYLPADGICAAGFEEAL
jgi:hypothetical protein